MVAPCIRVSRPSYCTPSRPTTRPPPPSQTASTPSPPLRIPTAGQIFISHHRRLFIFFIDAQTWNHICIFTFLIFCRLDLKFKRFVRLLNNVFVVSAFHILIQIPMEHNSFSPCVGEIIPVCNIFQCLKNSSIKFST